MRQRPSRTTWARRAASRCAADQAELRSSGNQVLCGSAANASSYSYFTVGTGRGSGTGGRCSHPSSHAKVRLTACAASADAERSASVTGERPRRATQSRVSTTPAS